MKWVLRGSYWSMALIQTSLFGTRVPIVLLYFYAIEKRSPDMIQLLVKHGAECATESYLALEHAAALNDE